MHLGSAGVSAFLSCLPALMGVSVSAPSAGAKPKDFSMIPGYVLGMEQRITTAGWPIFKLPRTRLSECIEFVDPMIDVTLTAGFPSAILAMILWTLTHVKPTLKVSELRASSYLDIYMRFRCAGERHKLSASHGLESYVKEFSAAEDKERFF